MRTETEIDRHLSRIFSNECRETKLLAFLKCIQHLALMQSNYDVASEILNIRFCGN